MKQQNAQTLLFSIGEIRDELVCDADSTPLRRIHRFPVILAAVLLCMALTVSALAAADVEPFYSFIYRLSPNLAQKLKPVCLSCTDKGIELEVISANVEGDTAQVFLGLRDLEGNRIDETTDLFDSYSIHMPSDMVGTCSFSHYDAHTGTAAFLVEITRGDGKPIGRDKLTFSLSRFISGKKEFAGTLDMDPSSAETNPAVQRDVPTRGYGWSDDTWQDFSPEAFLAPRKILSPMEDITLTGMGWIEGDLHIQTHYADILSTDAHGGISLLDAEGNFISAVYEESFWDEEGTGSYSEQVFRIDQETLETCRLFGQFYSSDTLVEGHWEITFPVG